MRREDTREGEDVSPRESRSPRNGILLSPFQTVEFLSPKLETGNRVPRERFTSSSRCFCAENYDSREETRSFEPNHATTIDLISEKSRVSSQSAKILPIVVSQRRRESFDPSSTQIHVSLETFAQHPTFFILPLLNANGKLLTKISFPLPCSLFR